MKIKLYTLIFSFLVSFLSANEQPKTQSIFLFNDLINGVKQVANNLLNNTTLSQQGLSTTSDGGNYKGYTRAQYGVNEAGAFTYKVPIVVPEGINQHTPILSIDYNSQKNDGLLGYGFQLTGISSIKLRDADIYHDGEKLNLKQVFIKKENYYVLDGKRLYKISNKNEFVTEVFSHHKIVKEEDSFIVYYPNGSKAYYGETDNSRHRSTEYAISRFVDKYGHEINYNYQMI